MDPRRHQQQPPSRRTPPRPAPRQPANPASSPGSRPVPRQAPRRSAPPRSTPPRPAPPRTAQGQPRSAPPGSRAASRAVPRPAPPLEPPYRMPHHRAPHRPSGARYVISLLGVTVLALLVMATFVYLRIQRHPVAAPPPAHVDVGSCVAAPSGDLLRVVDCTAADAAAKVATALADKAGVECPAETDAAVASAGRLLCLVNLRAPHPGAPGQGGGVIRAGDCVGNPGTGRTEERVCVEGTYYAKVLARVDTVGQCRAPAVEALSLRAASHPVACLAPRAVRGACVNRPTVGPPDVVACTSRDAAARVLARAGTASLCPVGTASTENALFGLPGQKVLCLGKLSG